MDNSRCSIKTKPIQPDYRAFEHYRRELVVRLVPAGGSQIDVSSEYQTSALGRLLEALSKVVGDEKSRRSGDPTDDRGSQMPDEDVVTIQIRAEDLKNRQAAQTGQHAGERARCQRV